MSDNVTNSLSNSSFASVVFVAHVLFITDCLLFLLVGYVL